MPPSLSLQSVNPSPSTICLPPIVISWLPDTACLLALTLSVSPPARLPPLSISFFASILSTLQAIRDSPHVCCILLHSSLNSAFTSFHSMSAVLSKILTTSLVLWVSCKWLWHHIQHISDNLSILCRVTKPESIQVCVCVCVFLTSLDSQSVSCMILFICFWSYINMP